ncbi:uncharacterized protein C20orf96 homolog isoform X1 [Pipistrellus kuhlii]|uniref:Uncharacterized protein n=2 Tax=Pipistrellus kuhlii TaxID=59472 RepID=A0A7J7Y7X3_PIPKU|nr:uncharacterized protein C20orf96 homolog isoform X1 [Pipistrellus kuhlii]XP_045430500.1 uncharacterized protein C20orf96 homolog isoform X1 [Pipistrellus kuhlii]KAF6357938.1 hypothetical protein mPipKuh1_001791 [Pipistrellus kuhlii]
MPRVGGRRNARRRSPPPKVQALDYATWQLSKQKIKPFVPLPVTHKSGHKKSKMKIIDQPVYPKSTTSVRCHSKNPQEPCKAKLDSGKSKFRLMRTLIRSRRTSLQELYNQENFLTKLNQELINIIKDMEDSSALKTRGMLQQQDIFGIIINSLGCSNKKKLKQMTCELQEWKEREESKMSYLKQQVEQLNDKLKKTQEEVNFLSTYMDHEYPVKVVQIANLLHQLEQVKDNQQDELDDFNKIGKVVLESLSDQIQMKKQKLVRSLVAKMQRPRQAFLLHRTQENQNMAKYADKYREFISQFEEKIPKLRAEVEQLRARAREPREVAFADVLLRRPRCTPDMDVTLSIPVEELLPF